MTLPSVAKKGYKPKVLGRRSPLHSGRRKTDSRWLPCGPRQARAPVLSSDKKTAQVPAGNVINSIIL